MRGTTLTDYERRLDGATFELVARYRERLMATLPHERPFLYTHRRLFLWARRRRRPPPGRPRTRPGRAGADGT